MSGTSARTTPGRHNRNSTPSKGHEGLDTREWAGIRFREIGSVVCQDIKRSIVGRKDSGSNFGMENAVGFCLGVRKWGSAPWLRAEIRRKPQVLPRSVRPAIQPSIRERHSLIVVRSASMQSMRAPRSVFSAVQAPLRACQGHADAGNGPEFRVHAPFHVFRVTSHFSGQY